MKKYCFLFLMIVLIFTGCSSKKPNFEGKSTLVCKKIEIENETTTNQTMIFAYDKNEKIHEFEINIEYVYDHEISKNAMDLALKGFEIFAKTLGIYFESIEDDNSLKFIFAGDIEKFEQVFSEVVKSDNLKNFNDKKSNALKKMTDEGFKCEDNLLN